MTADLGPAATPRPIPTPEDRMTAARLVGNQADIVFGTYLDRTERDQLDARAATAEQERDDALDDLQIERTKTQMLTANMDRYRSERDEALEARDAARRERDAMKAAKKRVLGRLEMAEHVIDLIRDGQEQIDRALATWDTQAPGLGSPADRAQDEPAELPAWVRLLVEGLTKYEDEHPKLYRHWGVDEVQPYPCPGSLLDVVPAELRMPGARCGRSGPPADGCGVCWVCRLADPDDYFARVTRAALDWRAARTAPRAAGRSLVDLAAAVDALLALPACADPTKARP